MFARRVVRGAASRVSATSVFCPAYVYQGGPIFSALKRTRTGNATGSRTMCSATQRPVAGEVGNGQGEEDGSQRLGREVAQALQSKGTRLVLHFDLNKTLIMVDPAGRKTQSQVLNSVLSEICWGHVETTAGAEQARSWKWDGCPPSPEPPRRRSASSSSREQQQPADRRRNTAASVSMSYSDFLRQEFGDAEGKDNRRMKDVRDENKGSFTEDGHPGAALRASYLLLERALSLPKDVAGSPLAEGAGLAGRKSYYVLPAFFSCLLALKDAGVDFGLVFRTFGDDIVGVSREHNAFCEGVHPLFPGVKMDGSDGRGDYRVHLSSCEHGDVSPNGGSSSSSPNTVGAFYRDEEGIALVMGTLHNPTDRNQLRSLEEAGHDVYWSTQDTHRAICERVIGIPLPIPPSTADEGVAPSPPGTSASAPPPTSTAALPPRSRRGRSANGDVQAECAGGKVRGRCLALRDFYPFWREKLEDATAGKVLPVDLSQSPKVWPILFDDNVGRPDSSCGAHIVDVRDVATGGPVAFDTAIRRHIVRAEPFRAIDQGAGVASAAASGYNFFLLEVLKRLAPARTRSFAASKTDRNRSVSAPQP